MRTVASSPAPGRGAAALTASSWPPSTTCPEGRAVRRGGGGGGRGGGAGRNTTLAVVATDARLDRVALHSLAHAAGDALARRIVPYGTPFDGDVVFAVSTAAVAAATPLQVEALAALALPEAVERAVRLARGARDLPGLADGGR